MFADPAFVERYLELVRGLLPAVIYYRMALVAPFRRYIPRGRSLLMKWGLRLLFFALVAIQWIPAVGGVVVPTMALVNYVAWRRLFLSTLRDPGLAPTPAAA